MDENSGSSLGMMKTCSSLCIATKLRGIDQGNDVLFQAGEHRRWEILGLFGAGSDGQDVKIACQSLLPRIEVESVCVELYLSEPPTSTRPSSFAKICCLSEYFMSLTTRMLT